nr:unnamed protein product [Spirometra erinaceieuropaei]
MTTLPTNIPRMDRPRRSSSDAMHQPPDDCSRCLYDRPFSNLHVYHDGAHSHQRIFESSCCAAVDQQNLHYLCHNCHDEDDDENSHLYHPRHRPKRSQTSSSH